MEFYLPCYLGRWYQIAAKQSFFYQVGDFDVTANYKFNGDSVSVINTSYRFDSDGQVLKLEWNAVAKQLDSQPIFAVGGDKYNYFIILLDQDYEWAVVTDTTDNLYILSRQSKLPAYILQQILQKTVQQGYSIEGLIYTPQWGV